MGIDEASAEYGAAKISFGDCRVLTLIIISVRAMINILFVGCAAALGDIGALLGRS